MIDRQKSLAILDTLTAAWTQSRVNSRDSRLHCGRLIREYIIQRLREVENLPEYRRGVSRQGCIEEVQSRLSIKKHIVNELIRVSAVVDLFWGNSKLPDKVSYSVLRSFQTTVCRPNTKVRRTIKEEQGSITLSEKERWLIKPSLEGEARNIFRSAIHHGWESKKILEHLNKIKPKARRAKYSIPDHPSVSSTDLFYVARNSSPRDLADMIMTLVEHSPSPDLVLKLISQRKINL